MAWGAVLIASAIPEIIYRQFAAQEPLWFPAGQALLLIGAAAIFAGSSRLKGLSGYYLALAALLLGWSVITPAIKSSSAFHDWTGHLDWGASTFVARLIPVSGALLMVITLFGSGITRHELFLRCGDLSAMSRPEPVPLFFRSISWTRLGAILLVIFGIALLLFLFSSLPLDFARTSLVLRFLPWGIATAALNAANEEFQFRNVLLARLRRFLSDREAMLMTAVLFGLDHFYGQPSGPIGVVMAGFAGWVWAKSMIETRGFMWAFAIHMVQDVLIFAFLAATYGG